MDTTVNSLTLGAASSNASGYSGIILIVLMIALMYFFMIRPQQKQRKKHQEMMNELHRGDEVVTIGRLHGKVDSIDKQNRTVTLDCEGIYLTFDMVAIARVVKQAAPATNGEPAEDSEATKEEKEASSKEESAKTTTEPESATSEKSTKDDQESSKDNQEK